MNTVNGVLQHQPGTGKTVKMQVAAGIGKAKEIDNISIEDATEVVKHWLGDKAMVNITDTHMKTLARNVLRSRGIGVLDALIEIEKAKANMPKTRGF